MTTATIWLLLSLATDGELYSTPPSAVLERFATEQSCKVVALELNGATMRSKRAPITHLCIRATVLVKP